MVPNDLTRLLLQPQVGPSGSAGILRQVSDGTSWMFKHVDVAGTSKCLEVWKQNQMMKQSNMCSFCFLFQA
jgi:hypothetical protein